MKTLVAPAPALGYALVIKPPEIKEAPANILTALVNVIIPISAILDVEDFSGIRDGQLEGAVDCYGVVVTFKNILAILEKRDLSAMHWFRNKCAGDSDAVLVFRSDEIEFLDRNMQKPKPLPVSQRFGMSRDAASSVASHCQKTNPPII